MTHLAKSLEGYGIDVVKKEVDVAAEKRECQGKMLSALLIGWHYRFCASNKVATSSNPTDILQLFPDKRGRKISVWK